MRILSCSGGGIRGLAAAIWLRELERRVGTLRDRFDLIAGTSTGALLACGVAAGLPAERFVRLYRDQGPAIFPRGARWAWQRLARWRDGFSAPLYDSEPLKAALRAIFGASTLGALAPRTMVVAYETTQRRLDVWKSWRDGELPIWEACAASAAAPAYFPAHARGGQAWIDGGVAANDPSVCAIVEAMRLGAVPGDIAVVSLSVGAQREPIGAAEALEWGPVQWAPHLLDVVFGGQAQLVDYQAEQLLAQGRYIRLEADLPDVGLADASPKSLAAIEHAAEVYLRSAQGEQQLRRAEAQLLGPREAA